jgi:CubicO group peptidase (beta-lactamase class C family)
MSMKKFILSLALIIVLICVALVATGNAHLFRAVQLTWLKGNDTANINDGKDFETNLIEAGKEQPWLLHEQYNQEPLNQALDSFLRSTNSVAYLIVKDGKLHTEYYFEPYHNRSKTNSFSMAKTMMTMLIGAAVDDGIIDSFDDPVWKYIPELKEKAPRVSLAHHAAMSSGIDWEEDYYSPFSPTPKLLYGYDVEAYALSREYLVEPGTEYYYASVSTQILGIALNRAQEAKGIDKTLSEYFSEKFWVPMGMNDDGMWHTDAERLELTYCCVNTNARNFAKFGLLLSQGGLWRSEGGDEKPLLSEAFVERMIKPDLERYYGHSVWTDDREPPIFYAMIGHLGQYVVVVPEHNMLVVRLGEFRDADADYITHFIPKEVGYYVDEAIKRVSIEEASPQGDSAPM